MSDSRAVIKIVEGRLSDAITIDHRQGTDTVIVAVTVHERKPQYIRLPGQLYLRDLRELRARTPGMTRMEVIAIDHRDWIDITGLLDTPVDLPKCGCKCGCHNNIESVGCDLDPKWREGYRVWACDTCLTMCDE